MQTKKLLAAAGVVLVLFGLFLWPDSIAAGLFPRNRFVRGELIVGLWIFKALLVLHGVLLIRWARIPMWVPNLPVIPASVLPEDSAPRWTGWAVLGVVLLGLALRLRALGGGLWFDEIQTLVDYVRLPLPRILATFDSQNQHLLYSIAARAAISVLGESAAALRLPAVLFGVGSLYAVYRFGRLVAGWREGLLAAALLAVSYHHVWFSQNARGYTGLLLFCLVASECLLRLLSGRFADGRKLAACYAVAMALAVYTHATAAIIGVAHAMILIAAVLVGWPRSWSGEAKATAFGIALSASLTLLLFAPVLPQFAETLTEPSAFHAETVWQSPGWLAMEVLGGLARGLPGGWLTLGVGLIVLVAGLVSYARQSPALLLVMTLPGVVTLFAIVLLQHNLWPRFFFFSAGFAVLIVIRGGFTVTRWVLPRHAERLALAGTLLVIAASALTVPRAWGPKQDYAAAAAFVDQARGPQDATVTVDLTEFPYARYYDRDWPSVQHAEDLAIIEHDHPRTWVLYTFPVRLSAAYPDLWGRLETRYERAAVFPGTVGGGEVVVLVSRPATDSTPSQGSAP